MLPSDAKAYLARWEAVAQVEGDEQRQATVHTRWKQLNAIVRLAMGLRLTRQPAKEELLIYQRWAYLRHSFENAQ